MRLDRERGGLIDYVHFISPVGSLDVMKLSSPRLKPLLLHNGGGK